MTLKATIHSIRGGAIQSRQNLHRRRNQPETQRRNPTHIRQTILSTSTSTATTSSTGSSSQPSINRDNSASKSASRAISSRSNAASELLLDAANP